MTGQERQRRFLRFSLRTLLMFVVVLSVPLSWFAWKMQKAKRQREAVEGILESGGQVYYEHQFHQLGALERSQATEPTWVQTLLGRDDVVQVRCYSADFGDDEARYLKELTDLRGLYLDRTGITDDGLANVAGMTKLQWLSLGGTRITDNGLVHVKGLAELCYLNVVGTQVTDDGVKELHKTLLKCVIGGGDLVPFPQMPPNSHQTRYEE